MAYEAGSIIARFKTDITNLKKGFTEAKQGLTQFQQTAMQVGQKMQSVGMSLTKNVTMPLIALTGASVKFGMEFEDAMQKSVSIMDGVTPEIRKQMEEVARSLAIDPTVNKSAEDLAQSYFYLASAGLDAQQSMEALPRVAKFATAGNFDMAKATDLLTDAQSALGLTVEDTAENIENMVNLSDVLVKANTLANASVEQFSESLTSKSATAMANYNVALEEGVAVLAAFADRGIKGRRAGEEFSRMLRYMQKSALENADALKQHNVEVYDSEGNLRNLADIIADLENALEGMSEQQKAATLDQMGFTAELQGTIMTLMGTSEQVRKYQRQLENAGGITSKVAQEQMQSMKEQLGQLKNLFIENALQAYEFAKPTIEGIVIPALTNMTEITGKLLDVFNSLPKPVQTLISGFTTLAIVAGPVLMIGGKIVTMFVSMKTQIATITTFIQGAGGLKMAIAGLSGAFTPFLVGGGIILGLVKILEHLEKMKQLSNDIKNEVIQVNNINEAQKALARVREEMEWIEDRGSNLGQGLGVNKIRTDDNTNYQALAEKEKQLLEQIKSFEKEKRDEVEKTGEVVDEVNAEGVASTEESEAEKLEARQEYEQRYRDLLFEATHSRIEILEREKEQALEVAKELNADTFETEKYYNKLIAEEQQKLADEKERIAIQEAEEAEMIEQQKQNKIENVNKQWNDKYFKATHDRIEILDYEKQQAVAYAESIGAETTNIIKYYELMKQQALKETQSIRDENLEKEKANTEIITEVLEAKNIQVEKAKNMYSALGNTYDYNSQLLNIYRQAITQLIEQGISPNNSAVQQLVQSYNQLSAQINTATGDSSRINDILQNITVSLQEARVKNEAYGDSFDFTAKEIGILETAINQLIAEGLTMQDKALYSLVKRYNQLKSSADSAYESMKRAGGVKGASNLSIEQLRQLKFDELTNYGEKDYHFDMNEEERRIYDQLVNSERAAVSSQERLDYEQGWATTGGSSINNDVTINQNISDKETADYATDQLVEKLQDRGVGGAYR